MAKQALFRWTVASATLMVVAFLTTGVMAADPSPQAAQLDTFTHADGASYFVMKLKPAGAMPAAGPCNVVVIVDTSATQEGEYRDEQLALLLRGFDARELTARRWRRRVAC